LKREGRMWYAGNLIDTVMIDFEAPHVLLESKLYPQSVFRLQQAMEKAIKAIPVYLSLVPVTTTVWLGAGAPCLKRSL